MASRKVINWSKELPYLTLAFFGNTQLPHSLLAPVISRLIGGYDSKLMTVISTCPLLSRSDIDTLHSYCALNLIRTESHSMPSDHKFVERNEQLVKMVDSVVKFPGFVTTRIQDPKIFKLAQLESQAWKHMEDLCLVHNIPIYTLSDGDFI